MACALNTETPKGIKIIYFNCLNMIASHYELQYLSVFNSDDKKIPNGEKPTFDMLNLGRSLHYRNFQSSNSICLSGHRYVDMSVDVFMGGHGLG